MNAPPPSSSKARQRGVTLIEVLITMIVTAIGLLGFSALQTVAMKNNRNALYRSYATMYAYEILDCMRVNSSAATDYADTTPVNAIAAADKDYWETALSNTLPNGTGSIDFNADNSVTVTIQWNEQSHEGSSTKIFTTQSKL